MPWKPAAPSQLQRENDALKTTIVCLRRELENKQAYVGKLEYLLCSRLTKIDELNGRLEQARAANQRLEQECGHLADMIRIMPQLDPAMLAAK
jgi:hypothetical protein